MAKPVKKKSAKKKSAVVKKKVDYQKLDAAMQEAAEEEVSRWIELTEHRGKVAKKAYDAQSKRTQEVLDAIVDRLLVGATGIIRVAPEGSKGEAYAVEVSKADLRKNALFLATEILKDLALLDFRVEDYEFPPQYCAACGVKLNAAG